MQTEKSGDCYELPNKKQIQALQITGFDVQWCFSHKRVILQKHIPGRIVGIIVLWKWCLIIILKMPSMLAGFQ